MPHPSAMPIHECHRKPNFVHEKPITGLHVAPERLLASEGPHHQARIVGEAIGNSVKRRSTYPGRTCLQRQQAGAESTRRIWGSTHQRYAFQNTDRRRTGHIRFGGKPARPIVEVPRELLVVISRNLGEVEPLEGKRKKTRSRRYEFRTDLIQPRGIIGIAEDHLMELRNDAKHGGIATESDIVLACQ